MRNTNIIYPVINDHLRFNINVGNKFFPGRTYIIGGVAFGKLNMETLERNEFWEIYDKHNTNVKPEMISKKQFNRLFDEGKIIETNIKTL